MDELVRFLHGPNRFPKRPIRKDISMPQVVHNRTTIKLEDSDEEDCKQNHLEEDRLNFSTAPSTSQRIKRSSSSVSDAALRDVQDTTTTVPAPASVTDLTTPTRKAKQPESLKELKSKLMETRKEKNKEKKLRITRDKELKELRKELADKDQALISITLEKTQANEKVRAMEKLQMTSAQHEKAITNLHRYNSTLKEENTRMSTMCQSLDVIQKEHNACKAENEQLKAHVLMLGAQVNKLGIEIEPLREFKANVTRLSQSHSATPN